MKLATRYALMTSAVVAAVVGAVTITVARAQRQELERQSHERLDTLMEGVTRVGAEALAAKDELMLVSYLMFLQKEHPEISYAAVTRRGHTASVGATGPGLTYLSRTLYAGSSPVTYTVKALPGPTGAAPGAVTTGPGGLSLNFQGTAAVSINEGKPPQSVLVALGFSTAKLRAEIDAAVTPLLRKTLALSGLFMGLGILGSIGFSLLISKPLASLSAAASMIAGGKLDVSVAKSGPDEVRELGARFNEMAGRLREGKDQREELMRALTHDLNAPMAWLKSYLDLWRSGELELRPMPSETSQAMASAIISLDATLKSALRLLYSGGPLRAGTAQPVALHDVVRQAAKEFAPIAFAKRVQFYDSASAVAVVAELPQDLASDVIRNLIAHALWLAPVGGLVMTGMKDDGERILFWVSHTGPGLAPEDVPHIFERLYRVGKPGEASERITGTSAALKLAAHAAAVIGGRLWIQNEPGAGSVYFAALPKRAAQNGEAS